MKKNSIWAIPAVVISFSIFCNNCIAASVDATTEKTIREGVKGIAGAVDCDKREDFLDFTRGKRRGCNFLKKNNVDCSIYTYIKWYINVEATIKSIEMQSPLPICFDQNKWDFENNITKMLVNLNYEILKEYHKNVGKITVEAKVDNNEKEKYSDIGDKRIEALRQEYKDIKDMELPGTDTPVSAGSDEAQKVYFKVEGE